MSELRREEKEDDVTLSFRPRFKKECANKSVSSNPPPTYIHSTLSHFRSGGWSWSSLFTYEQAELRSGAVLAAVSERTVTWLCASENLQSSVLLLLLQRPVSLSAQFFNRIPYRNVWLRANCKLCRASSNPKCKKGTSPTPKLEKPHTGPHSFRGQRDVPPLVRKHEKVVSRSDFSRSHFGKRYFSSPTYSAPVTPRIPFA